MRLSGSPSAQVQPPARDPPRPVVASVGDDDQNDSTYPCAVRHRRCRNTGRFVRVRSDDPMPTLFDLN